MYREWKLTDFDTFVTWPVMDICLSRTQPSRLMESEGDIVVWSSRCNETCWSFRWWAGDANIMNSDLSWFNFRLLTNIQFCISLTQSERRCRVCPTWAWEHGSNSAYTWISSAYNMIQKTMLTNNFLNGLNVQGRTFRSNNWSLWNTVSQIFNIYFNTDNTFWAPFHKGLRLIASSTWLAIELRLISIVRLIVKRGPVLEIRLELV